MSSSSESGESDFRNAALAELRHNFRSPIHQVLAGTEILIEEASALRCHPALDLLRHIHSAGLAALSDVSETLSNRDTVEPGELELLCAKIRPRSARILSGLEALNREAGLTMPEEWRDDLVRIAGSARSLTRLLESVPAQPLAELPPSSKPAERPEAPRLLVAGGEALERSVLCRRLERQGYAALEARDDVIALDLVVEEHFDLVLLDLAMPPTDAFDLLERIQSGGRRRATPVVVIASFDETARLARALQMGAEDYVLKPFDPLLLRVRINIQLEKRRLREQLSARETPAAAGGLGEPLDSVVRLSELAASLVREQSQKIAGLGIAAADAAALVELAGRLEQCTATLRRYGECAGKTAAAGGDSATPLTSR